ncbi:MAG TPA: porin family protein [Cytophagaceae bacterium]|nr:porin family protein [Cytophagaceae bacterium]
MIQIETSAQNDCPQVLKKARNTYEEGRISEISDILESCLKDKTGFNKEERIEAYKLLTLTWLYFNERTKAEECMYNFLKLNPEYVLNETVDPTEFINLYTNFRTSPVLIYGIKLGFNNQDINVIQNFSVDNSTVNLGKYKSALGLQMGVNFEVPLHKNLSLVTELNLVRKNHTYSDEILNFAKINFHEKQTLLEVPILIHLNFSTKKFIPYLNFGGTFGCLINDKAIVSRKDRVSGTQVEVSGPELKILTLRHKLLYSASLGVGFKLKNIIGNGYIIVEARYNVGLRNSVNPRYRTSNSELIYNYLYLDNDFRMNSFVCSLGFALPSYRPRIRRIQG